MLDIHSTSIHAKAVWSLLVIYFAVGVVATVNTRKVEAINFAAQEPSPTPQTKGKVNGRIVFTSDRQRKYDLKLWSMNPDGSNPTQLTDESGRDPSLPS